MEKQRDGCDCGLVLRGPQARQSDNNGDQHSFCKKENQGLVLKKNSSDIPTKREMVCACDTWRQ